MVAQPIPGLEAPDWSEAASAAVDLRTWARRVAQQRGVPEDVLLGVLDHESGLDPKAWGNGGGVGQFIESTARAYGSSQAELRANPRKAVDLAARLLRDNADTFGGDFEKGAAAYFVGAGNVQQAEREGGGDWLPRLDQIARKYNQGTVSSYLSKTMGADRPSTSAQRAGGAPTGGDYVFPVEGYREKVNLHWGTDKGGADLFAARGTPVRAMNGGRVVSVGSSGLGGNNVTIRGNDGRDYYYAHGDRAPEVKVGQTVPTGQYLFGVGDSGNAKGTGTHLHLGIGNGIISGTGATGGSGRDFDAVGLLSAVLSGSPTPPPSGAEGGGASARAILGQAAPPPVQTQRRPVSELLADARAAREQDLQELTDIEPVGLPSIRPPSVGDAGLAALGQDPYDSDSAQGGGVLGSSIGGSFDIPELPPVRRATLGEPEELGARWGQTTAPLDPGFSPEPPAPPEELGARFRGPQPQVEPGSAEAFTQPPPPPRASLGGINPNQGGFRDPVYNPANVEAAPFSPPIPTHIPGPVEVFNAGRARLGEEVEDIRAVLGGEREPPGLLNLPDPLERYGGRLGGRRPQGGRELVGAIGEAMDAPLPLGITPWWRRNITQPAGDVGAFVLGGPNRLTGGRVGMKNQGAEDIGRSAAKGIVGEGTWGDVALQAGLARFASGPVDLVLGVPIDDLLMAGGRAAARGATRAYGDLAVRAATSPGFSERAPSFLFPREREAANAMAAEAGYAPRVPGSQAASPGVAAAPAPGAGVTFNPEQQAAADELARRREARMAQQAAPPVMRGAAEPTELEARGFGAEQARPAVRSMFGDTPGEQGYGRQVRRSYQERFGPEETAKQDGVLTRQQITWADYGDAARAFEPDVPSWQREPETPGGLSAFRGDPRNPADVAAAMRESVQAVRDERAGLGTRAQMEGAQRTLRGAAEPSEAEARRFGAEQARAPLTPAQQRRAAAAEERRVVTEERRRIAALPPAVREGTTTWAQMVDNAERILREGGGVGRTWYPRVGQELLQLSHQNADEAARRAGMLAMGSPQNPVKNQGSQLLKGIGQRLRGEPMAIHTATQNRRAEIMANGTPQEADDLIIQMLKEPLSTAQRREGRARGLTDEQMAYGRKTANFFLAMLRHVDPERHAALVARAKAEGARPGVTVDMHVQSIFGFDPKKSITDRQYSTIEQGVQDVAERMGWDYDETQAAFFTADILRNPGARVNMTPERAAEDYADALRDYEAIITWETAPGNGTPASEALAGFPNWSYPDKLAFHADAKAAVIDPVTGVNKIAQAVGLPGGASREQVGFYEGGVNPGVASSTYLGPDLYALADETAALMGYATQQTAVPWTRRVLRARTGEHNGVVFQMDRPMTPEEMLLLGDNLGTSFVVMQASDNRAVVVRLKGKDDFAAQTADSDSPEFKALRKRNKAGHKRILKVADEVLGDDVTFTPASGAFDGGYPENDWTVYPNGEAYLSKAPSYGRGHERSAVVGPVVDQARADYTDAARQHAALHQGEPLPGDRDPRYDYSKLQLNSGLVARQSGVFGAGGGKAWVDPEGHLWKVKAPSHAHAMRPEAFGHDRFVQEGPAFQSVMPDGWARVDAFKSDPAPGATREVALMGMGDENLRRAGDAFVKTLPESAYESTFLRFGDATTGQGWAGYIDEWLAAQKPVTGGQPRFADRAPGQGPSDAAPDAVTAEVGFDAMGRPLVGGASEPSEQEARRFGAQQARGAQNPVQPEDIAFGEQQAGEAARAGMRPVDDTPGVRSGSSNLTRDRELFEGMGTEALNRQRQRFSDRAETLPIGEERARAAEFRDLVDDILERRASGGRPGMPGAGPIRGASEPSEQEARGFGAQANRAVRGGERGAVRMPGSVAGAGRLAGLASGAANEAKGFFSAPIALKSTLSPPLFRQGLARVMTNPAQAFKEFAQSMRVTFNDARAAQIHDRIINDDFIAATAGRDSAAQAAYQARWNRAGPVERSNMRPPTAGAGPHAGHTWQDVEGQILDWREDALEGKSLAELKTLADRVGTRYHDKVTAAELGTRLKTDLSPEDLSLMTDSKIGRATARVARSSNRQSSTMINLMRTNWYKEVAAQMEKAGITEVEPYRELRKTIEQFTQRGTWAQPVKLPVFFSTRAMSGRVQQVARAVNATLSPGEVLGGPGAKREAAKAFYAMTAGNLAMLGGIYAAASAAGLNPEIEMDGKLPTLKVGPHRWDPWAGLNTPARAAFGVVADTIDTAREEGVQNAPQGFIQSVDKRTTKLLQGGLSPVAGKINDARKGYDYTGQKYNLFEDFTDLSLDNALVDLTEPFITSALRDAVKEDSPVAAGVLAGPAFLSTGINSYRTPTDVADEKARAVTGKSLDELEPVQRLKYIDPEDRTSSGPMATAREHFKTSREQAGIVEPEKAPPGETLKQSKAREARNAAISEKNEAVYRRNPALEVQEWFFSGKHGGSLNSAPAVTQALSLNLPEREVRYRGADRNLATSQGKRLWSEARRDIQEFYDPGFIRQNQELAEYHAERRYERSYNQLPPEQKSQIDSDVRSDVREEDPELDALMAYMGFGGNSSTKRYLVHSQAATAPLERLRSRYGREAAKEGWRFALSANAR